MTDYLNRAPGSFGSRKGKAWSPAWSADESRAAPSDTAAGTFGSVMPIGEDVLRRAIEAQTCPWCGEGPFKVMALHTNLAHGVDGKELRRLAGLSSSASVCSPDNSERARRSLTQRSDWEEMRRKGTEASMQWVESGGRSVLSDQAKRLGSWRKALEASVRAEAWRTANEAYVKKAKAEREVRAARAVEMFDEGATIRSIVQEIGLQSGIVTQLLEERGRDVKGRGALLRREAQARRGARRRVAVVARFRALGGDWGALEKVAQEFEMTRKGASALLKAAGEDVPDGRAASTRRGRAGGRTYRTKPPVPCVTSGCDGRATRRGMCSKHYQRWRKSA